MSRRTLAARPAPGQSGFTLVEVLVAMTIMALMMSLLFGGLRLAGRAWDTTDRRLDESAAVQTVQGFVRQRLGEARKIELPDLFERRRADQIVFDGLPGSVRFVGTLPAHRGGGGLRLMVLFQRDGGLWLRYRDFVHDEALFDGGSAAWTERRLLEAVSGLSVRYYGRLAEAENPGWHSRWLAQEYLPRLVRIAVERPQGQRTRWPELLIRLPVTERSGRRPAEEGFGP